jgi:hypothetical protein
MKGKELSGHLGWWLRHQFTYVATLERHARRAVGYKPVWRDPTLKPPPSYTRLRADEVYGGMFQRVFEYLWASGINSDVYEFGTFRGYTARLMALHLIKFNLSGTLRLFDSFTGLPEPSGKDLASYDVATNEAWKAGTMSVKTDTVARLTEGLRRLTPGERLVITKGYFDKTLSTLDRGSLKPAMLVHLDCDLYESTLCVLRYLLENKLIADGAVVLCDDYNCNRAQPNQGQRLAMTDAMKEFPRFEFSSWFSYGWHGQAFFAHDRQGSLV